MLFTSQAKTNGVLIYESAAAGPSTSKLKAAENWRAPRGARGIHGGAPDQMSGKLKDLLRKLRSTPIAGPPSRSVGKNESDGPTFRLFGFR
jgi:hypothetical protein